MNDDIKTYEFKKTIDILKNFEGRGTELISLYVPPGRPISDVIAYLRDEYSTSSNIKSKTTRKNVTSAIESMMSRLKVYRMPPKNGLALFIGSIPKRGDQTEMVTYILEPPEPVPTMIYRCDSVFYLDPLLAMLGEKEVYGLIVIDRSEATIGFLKGTRIELIKNIQSRVPSKHHQGGQSSRRFERLIEQAAHEFFVKASEIATMAFLNEPKLKGILIGGPGSTKEFFENHGYLHHELQKKVIGLFDTGYTNEYGLKELVEKASKTLEDLEITHEKKLISEFLKEVRKITDSHATYGIDHVKTALLNSKVATLLISDGIPNEKITWHCPSCKRQEVEYTTVPQPEKICTVCNTPMEIINKEDIIETLYKLAEESGVKVEFISTDSEEGKIFLKAFGGIAAMLRY